MTTWNPISEESLNELIENSEWLMSEFEKSFWQMIRLEKPVKWQLPTIGDEGGGFWVVGVYANNCLYYNDIEDGFNESRFSTWGNIDSYFSNQTELHEFIRSILEYRVQAANK